MIFDKNGNNVASYQLEHEQIYPKEGWVEHNPMEILEVTYVKIIYLESNGLYIKIYKNKYK